MPFLVLWLPSTLLVFWHALPLLAANRSHVSLLSHLLMSVFFRRVQCWFKELGAAHEGSEADLDADFVAGGLTVVHKEKCLKNQDWTLIRSAIHFVTPSDIVSEMNLQHSALTSVGGSGGVERRDTRQLTASSPGRAASTRFRTCVTQTRGATSSAAVRKARHDQKHCLANYKCYNYSDPSVSLHRAC